MGGLGAPGGERETEEGGKVFVRYQVQAGRGWRKGGKDREVGERLERLESWKRGWRGGGKDNKGRKPKDERPCASESKR